MAESCLRHGVSELLVGSGADWDLSDSFAIPALAELLRQRGLAEAAIGALLWGNPLAFFCLSGRLPSDISSQLNAAVGAREHAPPAPRT